MNVVDSSGWLEYFANDVNASFFAPIIEATDQLIVPSITLYEVFKRVLILRGEELALQVIALMTRGRVVDLDMTLALESAKLSASLKLPMADSVILSTAYSTGATLWTQDADLAGLPGVEYILKPS